jgi:deoxyribodipyrimidine photolyase-related protein
LSKPPSRILYIPFDHLHADFGVLKGADPKSDLVVLVESQRMRTGRPWHPIRLFFLISSARHFAADLLSRGFSVRYIKAATTIDGLSQVRSEFPGVPFSCAEPSSFQQMRDLAAFGVEFVENDFFLTSRKDFFLWAERQKAFLMENFYRAQRVRLNVLVEGKDPVGGQWNFDKENRLPPPKNYAWPKYLEFAPDEIDREVASELGIEAPSTWATTRKGALDALAHFIKHNFANFGPYEDAMALDSWALHHSLLSPYINNGLLHPSEVISAAIKAFNKGGIPIASCEAFIRQNIGWREYINGMYWFLGEDYKDRNELGATRKLLPLFRNPAATSMNCMKSIVSDIEERAWVHHIPRLMVLSNLALISGVKPQEFLDWMREVFIDAAQWVMVPNVIGMGLHADGGQMMTKPYAAGGAYISRMSNYCKSCAYDPKKRIGEDACPFTTLYWDFLDRNYETFKKNHRMFQQFAGLKRLSDIELVRERARDVLEGLDKGII